MPHFTDGSGDGSDKLFVIHILMSLVKDNELIEANTLVDGLSGEAYLWAVKSTDKSITLRPTKISIRPRVTKHGGDTISAVKG